MNDFVILKDGLGEIAVNLSNVTWIDLHHGGGATTTNIHFTGGAPHQIKGDDQPALREHLIARAKPRPPA